MAEEKSKILIVEDDLDVADMLNAYFRVQGYEVFTVNWGEDGVRAALTARPDLIILDIRLPDIDGYEVARRLRSDRKTNAIPIIFLTEKRDRSDRLHGLELGADDYITKPFDVQELRLRVRNSLRRTQQDTLTNPVTSLPEGELVDEKLGQCLENRKAGLMAVSLDNLAIFRDHYGFVASDDVMRAVSLMLQNALREAGSTNDFLGHLSATEFVLVLESAASLAAIEERMRTRLEQSLDYFYPIKDREQVMSRQNRLAVRIGVLDLTNKKLDSTESLKNALLVACK
ncbi:MAG: response regulator [Anaerolineales bacterium]|nr:response regulator [Anaerolineales bacterium]